MQEDVVTRVTDIYDLSRATSIRYLIEWEGVGQLLLDQYISDVRSIAGQINNLSATDRGYLITDLPDAFGTKLSAYAQLVMRDVESYLTSGTIPMIPLCDSGL